MYSRIGNSDQQQRVQTPRSQRPMLPQTMAKQPDTALDLEGIVSKTPSTLSNSPKNRDDGPKTPSLDPSHFAPIFHVRTAAVNPVLTQVIGSVFNCPLPDDTVTEVADLNTARLKEINDIKQLEAFKDWKIEAKQDELIPLLFQAVTTGDVESVRACCGTGITFQISKSSDPTQTILKIAQDSGYKEIEALIQSELSKKR